VRAMDSHRFSLPVGMCFRTLRPRNLAGAVQNPSKQPCSGGSVLQGSVGNLAGRRQVNLAPARPSPAPRAYAPCRPRLLPNSRTDETALYGHGIGAAAVTPVSPCRPCQGPASRRASCASAAALCDGGAARDLPPRGRGSKSSEGSRATGPGVSNAKRPEKRFRR
jgi:hypothetical protein